jgi:hypothetical protein
MVSSTYGNAPGEGRYSWVKDGRVNLAGRGAEMADRGAGGEADWSGGALALAPPRVIASNVHANAHTGPLTSYSVSPPVMISSHTAHG